MTTFYTLLTFLMVSTALGVRFRSDPEVDQAVKKATAFILSRRDPTILEWRPMETAAAVLGLTSGDPLWRMNENHSAKTKIDVQQSVTALKLALSQILHMNDGSLSQMDDSTLAQFISAFQISCVNPSDVLGFDLLAEARTRMDKTLQRSPSLAGLSLPLCNARVKLPVHLIQKLSIPVRGRNAICQSLCLEKAALNVISLSCMFKDEKTYDITSRGLIFKKIQENVEYLKVKINKEEHSLFDTSLLLQARDVSPVALPLDGTKLFDDLLTYQENDGSFANSVSLTAIAIPALSHFNALDIQSVVCESKPTKRVIGKSWAIFYYEIHDVKYNTQSLFGEFNATIANRVSRESVLNLVNQFQDKYPSVFKVDIETTPFGSIIESLVGIPTNAVSVWNVYLKQDDGTEFIVRDIESTKVKVGGTVVFKYEKS